jgi:transcriptional regulator with XRE-family HTH domain
MIDPLDTGDLDKDVARRLTLSRMAIGGSQADFGKSAGMSQPRYSAYENGLRLLTLKAAMMLCERYDLTLDWLYRGDPSGLPARMHEAVQSVTRKSGERIRDKIASKDEARPAPKPKAEPAD